MTTGYLAYRCSQCGGDDCGNDATAGWDVVTQASVLRGEFDDEWCNDCGEVKLVEYTITDPTEIARIDLARAALAVEAAASQLLAAADTALMALSDLSTARSKGYLADALTQLMAAIAAARPAAPIGGARP